MLPIKNFGFLYEISHPWLENWESNRNTKDKDYGYFYVIIMLLNALFYTYFFVFTCNYASDLIDDSWKGNFEANQSFIYFTALLILIIFQMIYFIVYNHNETFIFTSFIWNSWYIFYVLSCIVLKEDEITDNTVLLFLLSFCFTIFTKENINLLLLRYVGSTINNSFCVTSSFFPQCGSLDY